MESRESGMVGHKGGVSTEQSPTPQILVFHTRLIPEVGRAELLAHCALAPPPCQPCRGSAEQPGYSMKGLSVWAERPVCLASPPSQPRGGGRGSRSPRAPILWGGKGA